MTESEAKKILDFLAKRYERRTNTLVYSFSKERAYDLNLLKDNLVVKKNTGSYYVWKLGYNCLDLYEKTVRIDGEMTAAKIVACLFNHSKTWDLVVNGDVFVFKGETIEELLVKADLEDF